MGRFGLVSSVAVLLACSALTGCGVREPKVVEILSAVVTPASPTVVRVSVAACKGQPYEAHVSESAGEVVVRLTTTRQQGAAAPSCSDLVSVQLHEPLGSRRLVDDSTNRPVSLDPAPTTAQPS